MSFDLGGGGSSVVSCTTYVCQAASTNEKKFSAIPDFNEIGAPDVLQDFDFDSFLHDGDVENGPFDFNPASFGMEAAPSEIGAE